MLPHGCNELGTILSLKFHGNELENDIYGVKRPRFVVPRSAKGSKFDCQIRHLDESLKPGVVLDIYPKTLDATGAGLARLQEMLDLVTENVNGEHRVSASHKNMSRGSLHRYQSYALPWHG